jgi:hypothetical protein
MAKKEKNLTKINKCSLRCGNKKEQIIDNNYSNGNDNNNVVDKNSKGKKNSTKKSKCHNSKKSHSNKLDDELRHAIEAGVYIYIIVACCCYSLYFYSMECF